MQDYQGNSHKAKKDQEKQEKTPVKARTVEKVVTGQVMVQKKGLGRKAKDLIIAKDLKGVITHVIMNVMIPAGKNLLWDAGNEALGRGLFGDAAMDLRRRSYGSGVGPRYSYNNSPLSGGRGGMVDPRGERYIPRRAPLQLGEASQRRSAEDLIFSDRAEAQHVLERMGDIIDEYDVVTVHELHELIGYPSNHVNTKWGWVDLGNVQVRQIREGYLLDLPPAELIG